MGEMLVIFFTKTSMQGCAVHVGREPSWYRPNSEYQKLLAPKVTRCRTQGENGTLAKDK